VVEVGGGLGILTAALVRRDVERLTVIERDPRLAMFLRSTFGDRIRVVPGDALRIPVEPAECYVGNLPYSVATPLLLRWMEARVPRIVFLVQREVAERLASAPGSKTYGRLSIIAQLYGRVELFRTVGPEAFTPRPQVESRIAVFERRSDPLPVPSVPELERIVRTLFASRRKQLGNLLPRVASSPDTAEDLAARAGWPETWRRLRPEDLPPKAYFALARAVGERGE
jgi:16S rRNA (adenine1518-N6/adenine1519-N6)-dimethyltransferase